MKRTAVASLLAFTVVSLSALPVGAQKKLSSDLKIKYDPFKGQTVIRTPESSINFTGSVWQLGRYTGGYGNIMVIYDCNGDMRKAPCRSPVVGVEFSASSRTEWGWEWRNDHDVNFLADGKRITTDGRPEWQGDVDSDPGDRYPLTEIVTAPFTPEAFHRMATAGRLEGEIGSYQFTLSKATRGDWRQIDRAILTGRRDSAR